MYFLLTGHEPHKLVRYHPWAAVCLFHRAVLWAGDGLAGAGSAQSQWDGWTSSDAQWLPQLPGYAHWECPSYTSLLQIHRPHSHLLQVSSAPVSCCAKLRFYFQMLLLYKLYELVVLLCVGSLLMRRGIWSRGTWPSTQTPTMRTLWATTIRNAGQEMLGWDWWNMM